MPLQLQHVLAGEGIRALEVERDAFVEGDGVALGIESHEGAIVGTACRRALAQHGLGDGLTGRTGDTDDADATTAGRSGQGRDGVRLVGGRHAQTSGAKPE